MFGAPGSPRSPFASSVPQDARHHGHHVERVLEVVGDDGEEVVAGTDGACGLLIRGARCRWPWRPGGPAPRPGAPPPRRSGGPTRRRRGSGRPGAPRALSSGTTIAERGPSARMRRRCSASTAAGHRGPRLSSSPNRSAPPARSAWASGRLPVVLGRVLLAQLAADGPTLAGSRCARAALTNRSPSSTSTAHQSASRCTLSAASRSSSAANRATGGAGSPPRRGTERVPGSRAARRPPGPVR